MKSSRKLLAAGLAGLLGLMAGPSLAHHSTSTFYLEETVDLSGAVQELIWANPHGVLVIQDADGKYWVGEMSAVVDLARQGLSPEKLPEGLDVDLTVLPSREGSNRVHVEEISVDGEMIYGTAD